MDVIKGILALITGAFVIALICQALGINATWVFAILIVLAMMGAFSSS